MTGDRSLGSLLRQPRIRRRLLLAAGVLLLGMLMLSAVYRFWNLQHSDSLLPQTRTPVWRESGHSDPYVPAKADQNHPFPVWPQTPALALPSRDREAVWKRVRQGQTEQQPLRGLVVFVDAGHGGMDSGAVWQDPESGHIVEEKQAALAIGRAIAQKLRALGAEVIELRTDDQFISLGARTAEVGRILLGRYLKELGALLTGEQRQTLEELYPKLQWIQDHNSDEQSGILGGMGTTAEARLLLDIERQFPEALFLSVHLNASEHEQVSGTQVYLLRNYLIYERQNTSTFPVAQPPYRWTDGEERTNPIYVDYDDPARGHLAVSLYEAIAETLPHMRTGAGARSVLDENFFVLRTCNLPSVLLETGFMTHASDRAYLFGARAPGDFAEAIARGLLTYVQRVEIKNGE